MKNLQILLITFLWLLLLVNISLALPTINTIYILPTTPNINDYLSGYVNATDDGGQNLTYEYKWYLNGEEKRTINNAYWESDSSIINGTTTDAFGAPVAVVYWESDYIASVGRVVGTVYFEVWNGTNWEDNATWRTGLTSDYGSNSYFHTFNISGKLVGWMTSTEGAGQIHPPTTYEWNGTSWVSNSTYAQGIDGFLGRRTYFAPYYNHVNERYESISRAHSDFAPRGYWWNETGNNHSWVRDDTISSGIAACGFSAASADVYKDDLGTIRYIDLCKIYQLNETGQSWFAVPTEEYNDYSKQNYYGYTAFKINNIWQLIVSSFGNADLFGYKLNQGTETPTPSGVEQELNTIPPQTENTSVIFSSRAYNTTDYSSWVNSTSVLVVGLYPPVALESILFPQLRASSNEDISGQCRVYDAEDDNITFILNWYKNYSFYKSENSTSINATYLDLRDYEGHWKLGGDDINFEIGIAYDETNVNNGTMYNYILTHAANYSTLYSLKNGYFGGAYKFNGGDEATGSYLDLNNDIIFGNGTIMMWFKRENNQSLDLFGETTAGRGYVRLNQGVTECRYEDDAGVSKTFVCGDIGVGEWHHLTMTRNSTNDRFYIDGNIEYTPNRNGILTISFIGRGDSFTNTNFNGTIDEVKMWNNTQLTQAEIQQEMYSANPINNEGLILSYSFEEKNSTYTYDTNPVVQGFKKDNISQGMRFDGIGGAGATPTKYINVDNNGDSFGKTVCNNGCTFAGWVRPLEQDYMVVIARADATGANYFFRLGLNGDVQHTAAFRIWENGVTGDTLQINGGNYTIGDWVHVVGVYDGGNATNGSAYLYVDGSKVATSSSTMYINATEWADNEPVLIGMYDDGTHYWPMNGSIDDVAVWSRALNDTEIGQLYTAEADTYGKLSYSFTLPSGETSGDEDVVLECRGFDSVLGNGTNSTPLHITGLISVIKSSRISPTVVYTDDILFGYCNATDVDNDTLTYNFRWYIDGVLNESGNIGGFIPGVEVNVNNLSTNNTRFDNAIIFSCQSQDDEGTSDWLNSSSVTILNSLPKMEEVYILPTAPYTYDTLVGYCRGSDTDLVNLSYNYTWYVNGIANETGTTLPKNYTPDTAINVGNLTYGYINRRDRILLGCYVTDGYSWSDFKTAEIIVENSIPITNSSIIIPTIAYADDILLGYCNGTDGDNDDLGYEARWYVNGKSDVELDIKPDGRIISDRSTNSYSVASYGKVFYDASVNGATMTKGYFGSGYKFDGGNEAAGDYLELVSNLEFDNGTIMMWFKRENNQSLDLFGETTAGRGYVRLNPGETECRYEDDAGVSRTFACGDVGVDEWHHIAMIRNSTKDRFYIDGNIEYTPNRNGLLTISFIGRGDSISNANFNGTIDEVRIWQDALNESEIRNEMNSANPIRGRNLRVSYSFNSTNATNYTLDSNNIVTGPEGNNISLSMYFDGVDDYINITNGELIAQDAITVSAWINPSDCDDKVIYVQNDHTLGRTTHQFTVFKDGGGCYIGYDNFHPVGGSVLSDGRFQENEWTHVVFTRFGNSTVIFYVNGNEDGGNATTGGRVNSGQVDETLIGTRYFDNITQKVFNGSMSDIKVWSRPLIQKEIEKEYNQTNRYTAEVGQQVVALDNAAFNVGDGVVLECIAKDDYNYANKLNSTIKTINETIIINDVYVTPTYPDNDENLNCNFNISDVHDLDMNVDVTWYNGTTHITAYDYTFNNVVLNDLYTTGVGTGSLLSTQTKDYESWKCGIIARTNYSNVTQNSSLVNLYPLESLTLYYPPNNTIDNHSLNATFSVIDWDGNINCSLNVNSTSVVNDSVINGTTTTIYYNLTADGIYGWNISCYSVSNPSPETLISENRVYKYDTTAVIYDNYGDNSNVIFPEINDTITLSVRIYDIKTDTCKLQIDDNSSWWNYSTIVVNASGNIDLNLTFIVRDVSTGNNTPVNWSVWCNDSLGYENISAVQTFYVKDLTYPLSTPLEGNFFKLDNTTVVSNALYPLQNLSWMFWDYSLFQAMINITCDINSTIYYWEQLDFNVTQYNHTDTINLTGLDLQKCNVFIAASDDHTDNEIGIYKEKKLSSGIEFNTNTGTVVGIKNVDKKEVKVLTKAVQKMVDIEKEEIKELKQREKGIEKEIKNVKTKKEKDRYTMEFKLDQPSTQHTFVVESDSKIYPRLNSKYPGHFVIWNNKTKTGTWIDFAEKNVKDYEIVKIDDYTYEVDIETYTATDTLSFESIGGTNVLNLSYDFYIGGIINISTLNRYDNGTYIDNWTVQITQWSGYPMFNQSFFVNKTNEIAENLTNGTYNFTFTHSQYFPQTYMVVVENSSQTLVYNTFQSVVYIIPRNIKTLAEVTNANVTVTNTVGGQADNFVNIDNVTTITVFYINASGYGLYILRDNYDPYNSTFNIGYQENLTIYADLSFIATFNFFDERTFDEFNISSADRVNFLLFCPGQTYTTIINATTQNIPIDCPYTKFKLVLDYGVTSYYRTFIFPPADVFNQSIYLIDLTTTQYVYNSLILDDLLSDYENPSIYVKRLIRDEYVIITSDYTDIENKIGAYLIENREYIIEVYSDNNPVRVVGAYSADVGGDKVLRLYDIDLAAIIDSDINSISYETAMQNISNTNFVVAVYDDTENLTTNVVFRVRQNSGTGPIVFESSVTGQPRLEFAWNASSYINDTLYSSITYTHPTAGTSTYSKLVNSVQRINLAVFKYVDKDFMNWFITLFLGLLAIMATIKTANYVSMVMIGAAALFVLFQWYQLAWSIIALAGIIALLSLLKQGDKNMSGF